MSKPVRVDKSAPPGFINVHPRVGRRVRLSRGPDLPPAGGSDGLEHKFVRCQQCGFIANTFVNQPGSGWGNEEATFNSSITHFALSYDDETIAYDSPIATYDGIGKQYNDVETGAGCPLCGSSEYV